MVKIYKEKDKYLISGHSENNYVCYKITFLLKEYEKISKFRLKKYRLLNTYLLDFTTNEEKKYVLDNLKILSKTYPYNIKMYV